MKEPIFTPKSVADLEEIWNYIGQHSPQVADRFIGELLQAIDRLAQYPKLGRPRPQLRKGVRSFPHGNYIILYDVVAGRVHILHVVSGFRDLKQLLETPP